MGKKHASQYANFGWLPENPVNRLVVTSATTARSPGNDWSISWHRLVDATESTAHFPGIDWSMQLNRPHDPFAVTGQYLSID